MRFRGVKVKMKITIEYEPHEHSEAKEYLKKDDDAWVLREFKGMLYEIVGDEINPDKEKALWALMKLDEF